MKQPGILKRGSFRLTTDPANSIRLQPPKCNNLETASPPKRTAKRNTTSTHNLRFTHRAFQDVFYLFKKITVTCAKAIAITRPATKMQGINRRYAIWAGILLLLLWLWVAFDRPYRLPTHSSFDDPYAITSQDLGTSHDIFDFPVVDSQAIRDVCSQTEWNSSVVFTCDNNHGGIGHVRNSILNCVRFAISAGASLVLPNIALREIEEHHQNTEMGIGKRHGPGRKGMDHFFDKQHFIDSMERSCPQLNLIPYMEQTAGPRRRGLSPESLVKNHPTSGLEHPEHWRTHFYTWVEKYISPPSSSKGQEEPIIIDLEQSFLQYPTHSDGHAFAHSFGLLLKFPPTIRTLATTTLRQLSAWHDLPPSLLPTFFGAHVRTENDFLESDIDVHPGVDSRHTALAPFLHLPGQASAFLEHASTSGIKIMYIASGTPSDIEAVSHLSVDSGYSIDVSSKYSLLKGRSRDLLEALSWDQAALVDFLVLLKAQEFAGVGHSSFSWNVALKREHEGVVEGNIEGVKHGILSGEGVWGDGRNTLYGVRKGYVESAKCLWE